MKVLIAEDEVLAAERLQELLLECEPDAQVVNTMDSVEDVVNFLSKNIPLDLMLLDIQLADGKSFEIFQRAQVDVPIIFTTAYDEYTLQAFKLHSIDYLLKPIQKHDLAHALDKFRRLILPRKIHYEELKAIQALVSQGMKTYKERFILKSGNRLHFKNASDIAYCYADGKMVYIMARKDLRKYLIDHTLEELEQSLNPKNFFRINRKFIVNVDCIVEVKGQMSTGLEVMMNQACEHKLVVSRDRAPDFKAWLNL